MEITITNGAVSATIRELGAELISYKKEAKEYMWSGNPDFWGKHSPVLFPIVGTLKKNTYAYNGKEYSLLRHGFARERNFVVASKEDSKVTFVLKADNVTYEVYPFDFELIMTYEIINNSLSINYEVKNSAIDKEMPFSLGAHPAFALPGSFEEYSLHFENDTFLTRYKLESDLVSDKAEVIDLQNGNLPLNYDLFKDDALVMKQLSSEQISILKSGNQYLKIGYQNFPHMGIWTKPGASFICIEPWQGYADTPSNSGKLSDKEGVMILQANQSAKFSLQIEIL